LEHNLEDIIRLHKSGVYFPPILEGEEYRLEKVAQNYNLKTIVVDMENVISKQAFLSKMAEEFEFPDYFGNNWDALFESLTDLSWMEATGYFIIIKNMKTFEKEFSGHFLTIRRIFEAVVNYWESRQVPFIIILSEINPELNTSSHKGKLQ
jgi:RNAse (barnase) inhibitor barstar